MSNETNISDGGPAFPGVVPDEKLRRALIEGRQQNGLGFEDIRKLTQNLPGMTLRDWFAGNLTLRPDEIAWLEKYPEHERDIVEAGLRYGKADAMLAARAGQGMASDPLHPVGRCTCGGEGACAWCRDAARRERETEPCPQCEAVIEEMRSALALPSHDDMNRGFDNCARSVLDMLGAARDIGERGEP